MYEKNKDKADFYLIYTKEAHASDRLFIIGADSKVALSGGKGPHGFDTEAMKKAFDKIVKPPSGK